MYMNQLSSLISWFVLALALTACGAVVYAHFWLHDTARERGSRAQSAEQRSSETVYASRLRILAEETTADRERLESLSRVDIVTIANTIESAGKSVGATAKVQAAIPVGSSIEIPGGDSLHAVAFIIQAEGSFASVVQFVRALGAFPGFSSVEQFEFERVELSDRPSQSWRSSVRLQMYTTSDISS